MMAVVLFFYESQCMAIDADEVETGSQLFDVNFTDTIYVRRHDQQAESVVDLDLMFAFQTLYVDFVVGRVGV